MGVAGLGLLWVFEPATGLLCRRKVAQLQQPKGSPRCLQRGVTMNSFTRLIAQCLYGRMQAVVDCIVVERFIGHGPEVSHNGRCNQ